ncbi:MAG: S8 family serine peptidase [Lachnospiraceae bacterium]|nr:S8 family serine peptidase [Lachnospiraceae bacterium]
MKILRRITAILAAAVLLMGAAGCSGSAPWDEPDTPEKPSGPVYTGDQIVLYDVNESDISYDEDTGTGYVNNIIVICVVTDASEADRQELAELAGGEIVGRNDPIGEIYVRINRTDLTEIMDICRRLEEDRRVVYAVFDNVGEFEEAPYYPDDSKYTSWEKGNNDNRNWGLIAVEAPGAWGYKDKLETVTVGIVDNGFLTTHSDLDGVITRATVSTSNEADHGTHVAGIIGAEQNNGSGVSGVAPNASILAYGAALNPNGSFVGSGIYAGLTACVTGGAKAVNFSLGSAGSLADDTRRKTDETINAEGRRASHAIGSLLAEGYDFVVVQSAGNGAANHRGVDAINNGNFCSVTRGNCDTSQASADDIMGRIIIVGNARRNGTGYMLSRSSCGGDRVDICAPGTNIFNCVTGTESRNNDGYSAEDGMYDGSQTDDADTDGRLYTYLSGTSMAAPHVTGIAALIWGADPDLTGREVKEIICSDSNSTENVADNPESPNTGGSFNLINARLCVEDALSRAGKKTGLSPYAEVVLEYEQIYGEFTVKKQTMYNGADQYYTGVFLVKLIDFDNDGSDELLIGYAEEKTEGYISWPYLDVWTMENGKAVPAFRDAVISHSDVGAHCEYTYYNGTWYLVNGYSGSGVDLDFLVLEGSEFHTEYNIECRDDDHIWRVNGTEVSDEEGSGLIQALLAECVSYRGMLLDFYDETEEGIRADLEEGKRSVGL